jgi:hypothetical protein
MNTTFTRIAERFNRHGGIRRDTSEGVPALDLLSQMLAHQKSRASFVGAPQRTRFLTAEGVPATLAYVASTAERESRDRPNEHREWAEIMTQFVLGRVEAHAQSTGLDASPETSWQQAGAWWWQQVQAELPPAFLDTLAQSIDADQRDDVMQRFTSAASPGHTGTSRDRDVAAASGGISGLLDEAFSKPRHQAPQPRSIGGRGPL